MRAPTPISNICATIFHSILTLTFSIRGRRRRLGIISFWYIPRSIDELCVLTDVESNPLYSLLYMVRRIGYTCMNVKKIIKIKVLLIDCYMHIYKYIIYLLDRYNCLKPIWSKRKWLTINENELDYWVWTVCFFFS